MKSKLLFLLLAFALHQGIIAQSPKKVLFEEINGAWCGRVPFGDWQIDNHILPNYPNVIPVILHYGTTTSGNNSRYDLLSNPYSDSIIHHFYVGVPHPAPQALIDRTKFANEATTVVDRPNGYSLANNSWKNHVATRTNVQSAVGVTVTGNYDKATRSLNAVVNANFVAATTGDLRINLWIVEDNVVGSGYGYDQHTYDYNTAQSPFYHVGLQGVSKDSIPGYVHRHVLRGGASPAWGSKGIIAASVAAGQNFSANYSYAVPANWNEDNIKLVAFISKFGDTQTNHEVLNAEQIPLTNLITGIDNTPAIVSKTIVFPNPASGKTHVAFSLDKPSFATIEIINTIGKKMLTVAEGFLPTGKHTAYFDASQFPNGFYLIRVKTDSGECSPVKFMVIN